MDKVIINFAPTGMIPTKADSPYVPITTSEIIKDVETACQLGISMVHLHARNADETSSYYKEIYGEIIEGIRRFAPELIICVSTSGRAIKTFEARSDVLSLTGEIKPDMASLTLSSLNFNKSTSVNEPAMIIALAQKMKENGIKPELEIFDIGMVNYLHYLIKKDLISPPYYTNLILGNIACAQADLSHIGCIMNYLPGEINFALGAVGGSQLKMNSLGIAMGWGVRVGLEDNYWYDETRSKLATNESLLKRIHRIISANEKTFMSSKELRQRLGLEPGFGHYGIAGLQP